jgi:hypothetical protein
MRIGANPAKENPDLSIYGMHRVIIPVYIPHFEGYFQHALEVLQLCLESLRLTTEGRAAVTIIANGCVAAVLEELERHYQAGWLDQLLFNRDNRGKVDAVVAAARGCFEPLITIADCDVLFKQGWLEAIEELFQTFPECGFACPFPSPAGIWYHTSASILGAFARGELRFEKVADDAALDRFAHSIGRPDFFNPELRKAQLVVSRQGRLACVGAGHFAFTLRREALARLPARPSLTAVSGNSEALWLDSPPDELGFWRLSTPQAWVSHMGNTPEEWMYQELASIGPPPTLSERRALPPAKRRWPRLLPISVRRKLIEGIKRAQVRKAFYQLLGYPDHNLQVAIQYRER